MIHRTNALLCALLLTFAAATAAAQNNEAPADPPPAKANLDTPRATLKTFHTAIRGADREAFRACLIVPEGRGDYVDALFDMMTGVVAFQKAVVDRFGEEGLDAFQEAEGREGLVSEPFPTDEAWLERLQITARENEATVRDPAFVDSTLHLVKRGDTWRIDLLRNAEGKRLEGPEDALAVRFLAHYGKTLRTTAADIAAGKFETAEAVQTALTDRLQAVRVNLVEELLKRRPETEDPAGEDGEAPAAEENEARVGE